MTLLVSPRARKPPPGPIRLDPSNALTIGIVSCFPFMDGRGTGVIDIVPNPQRVNAGSGTVWVTGKLGNCAYNWDLTNASTTDLAFVSTAFTVAVLFNCTVATGVSTPTIVGRSVYTSESVNTGWTMSISTTPFWEFVVFGNNAFGSYQLLSTTTPSVGDHMLVGTADGVGQRNLYVDGVLQTTGTANPAAIATSGDLLTWTTNVAPTYLLVIWNRVLSAFEVASLTRNPWQLFGVPSLGVVGSLGSGSYQPWYQLAPILAQ